MSNNKNIVKWITGIIVIVFGARMFGSLTFVGTIVILYGIVIIPPIGKKVFSEKKEEESEEGSKTKKCPACAEEIIKDAKVCKHCGKTQPVKMPRWAAVFSVIFMTACFVSFVTAISSPSAPSPAPSSAPASQPVQVTDIVPVDPTSQQNLVNAITTLLQQNSSKFSYKDSNVDTDTNVSYYPRPKGSKFITIDINTTDGSFLNDTDVITSTGKFATSIFQQVFPIDPSFYDISVVYYGTITDKYGNSKNGVDISYEMDRPLYQKIDWSGFSDLGNDLNLCAFLREDFNAMPQADKDISYVSCVVDPYNLMSAEDKIETSNPQFSDIPQYSK